jgi:outer membrane protein assembly factor BamB
LEDFKEYVDLKRFQYALCAYSGSVLAIATQGSLILTDDSSGEEYDSTRLVLEFNEDSGRASCIQWIIEGEVVAVGFESGLVVCFNCKGEEIWEFKGAASCVQAIKVASTAIHKTGAAMWLLYEEGLLVSVS